MEWLLMVCLVSGVIVGLIGALVAISFIVFPLLKLSPYPCYLEDSALPYGEFTLSTTKTN